jgi:hypothetical protein
MDTDTHEPDNLFTAAAIRTTLRHSGLTRADFLRMQEQARSLAAARLKKSR